MTDQFNLTKGCSARVCSSDEIGSIISKLWPDVFESTQGIQYFCPPAERHGDWQELATSFEQIENHERWIFYNKEGQAIGWAIGEIRDHLTFYMRNSGIIKSHRRMGIYSSFLTQFVQYLFEQGYERIISHHQVNNNPVIIAKLKSGFVINGMDIDERYGLQVQLVKFKHQDREAGFKKVFSLGSF